MWCMVIWAGRLWVVEGKVIRLWQDGGVHFVGGCEEEGDRGAHPGEPEEVEAEVEFFFEEAMGEGVLEVVVGAPKAEDAKDEEKEGGGVVDARSEPFFAGVEQEYEEELGEEED